jgi:signal transduction histidine kinase
VQTLVEVAQWLQTAAFVLIAVWSLRRWHERGDEASRWLALTFVSIGLVVVTGEVLALLPTTTEPELVSRAMVAVLVLFPYLLLRFLASLERVPPVATRTLGGLVVVLAVTGLLLPMPDEGAARSVAFQVFALTVVASWVVTLPYVSVRFWRAGAGQPTLVRRRLRLLAMASLALSIAILLAGVVAEPGPGVQLATTLVALTAAGLFLIGFAPPGPLRRLWRYPEEQELHSAAVSLMTTTSETQVARVLLPHLRRLVGARAVAMVQGGEVLGSDGLGDTELAALRQGDAGASLTSSLSGGTLHLWTDLYTPFFGEEELDLLERLGLLADLALDRARLLGEQAEARVALEHANAELESFVYSASHDLKSPLIAMLGYVDLLTEDHEADLGDEGRWYLGRIQTNGRYMEALIRDLLELSRVGRVQTAPDRVDLGALGQEIAVDVERQHPTATVEVGPLPVLSINAVRARQLLANLIENAAKHAGDQPVTIRLSSRLEDGAATIRIADDGPGIPEAYRERIFGVFERLSADDAHGGTGIGLAICRKIAEASGGQIWIAETDVGTEFRLQFPSTLVLAPAGTSQEVPA